MGAVVSDFKGVATGYAAQLRAALAAKASAALQQTVNGRLAHLQRLQTQSALGMLNLSCAPSDPIGVDDCMLLAALCATTTEMGTTEPVTLALATGRSYSCWNSHEASISFIAFNGTQYTEQLLKWVPDSSSAVLTKQRCLTQPPTSNVTVGKDCPGPQGCSCGQDQRCTVWYKPHVADAGPSFAKGEVFRGSSGALATSISFSLFSVTAPALIGVVSNNMEFAGIDYYLASLVTVPGIVLAMVYNDTVLTAVGSTGIKCGANETAPGDPTLPTWSILRSCDPGLRAVAQWLLLNCAARWSSASLQLSGVVWDMFVTDLGIMSYFLIVGSQQSVINAAVDASDAHASSQLTTVRTQQLGRVAASGAATKTYISAVGAQNTQASQVMEDGFKAQIHEMENTSRAALVSSQQRGAAQVRQLMISQTAQIESLTSKHLDAMAATTGWTIVVILTVLLLVLLCSAWGTVRVTHDLTGIINFMEDVASMRVEDLSVPRQSQVTEVARIEVAFQVLVQRLAEYKSYIPAGVFEEMHQPKEGIDPLDSDVDSHLASTPGNHCAPQPASLHTDKQKGSLPTPLNMIQAQPYASFCSRTSPSSLGSARNPPNQRVAALSINLFNFTEVLLQMAPALAKHLLSQFVTHIHEAATQGRGNVDLVAGDQIFVTFNAHIPCADPAAAAVVAALEMRWLLRQTVRERLKFQTGISFGPAIAGSVGYAKFRSMATVGYPVKVASMVSQIPGFESGTVLADSSIEDKVKYEYDLRPVEAVHFPQLRALPSRGCRVFSVGAKRHLKEDEWLYQVDTMSPKRDDWRQVFGRVMAAQTVEEGRGHLEEFLATHPQDAIALRLRDCLPMWTPGLGLPLWDRAHHDDGHTLCP
eukprot:GGOE01030435.1.p1 GENE.GGOE01030435.1~~GGOE01030435.1.p1  ORF type:complete len:1014 (-),score=314.01 GGOE01030435.1:1066-3681(-)